MPQAIAEDHDEGLQARVLAWMAETGRGYKAASKEFGVPRTTIQRWKRGGGEASSRAPPPPRARAQDAPEQEQLEEPPEGEDWISFLRRKVTESEQAFRVALQVKHTSSMVRLQDLTVRYREKLELALQAREAEERMGEDMPEPGQLAGDALRAVLADVAELARLQPELCRKVAAELEAAVGG